MPAYLVEIVVETCEKCGRKATRRLFNAKNAPCGAYCKTCGEKALKEMNA